MESCAVEQSGQLVWFISRRSRVQIPPAQPNLETEGLAAWVANSFEHCDDWATMGVRLLGLPPTSSYVLPVAFPRTNTMVEANEPSQGPHLCFNDLGADRLWFVIGEDLSMETQGMALV